MIVTTNIADIIMKIVFRYNNFLSFIVSNKNEILI